MARWCCQDLWRGTSRKNWLAQVALQCGRSTSICVICDVDNVVRALCVGVQVSFATLLAHLSIENLVQVFAALLLERKLIFCSRHLRYLASIQMLCVSQCQTF